MGSISSTWVLRPGGWVSFCYVSKYFARFKHVGDKYEYRKLDQNSVPGFSGQEVGSLFAMYLVTVQDSNT